MPALPAPSSLRPVAPSATSSSSLPSLVLHQLANRANDRIAPNERNTHTIIAIVIFFVFGFVFWHLPIARDIIAAHKLLVTGWHELCHVAVGLACGGQVEMICIDPNVGGRTQFTGLLLPEPWPGVARALDRGALPPETVTQAYRTGRAVATLSAGYFGGQLLGGVLILCAFDITASKIASFFVGLGLVLPLALAASWIPYLSAFLTEGLMIGLWFGAHGEALRYFVLGTGTLMLFFVVWDVTDERFFGKKNPSDASQFEELVGGSASIWALYFFLLAVLVLTAAVIGGIALFRRTPAETWAAAGSFLPT